MSNKSSSRVARPKDRSEIERQELAGAIRRALPRDGRVEMQPGLTLFRVSTPTEPVYGVSESSFCVIAQGAKHVILGEDRFRYDPHQYLISTVGLPTISQIEVASSEQPYLGLRLILEPAVVTSTMVEAGLVHRQNESGVKAIAVSALDPDLLNACLRLVRLLQTPEQYRVLGPLVIREIVYRLLIGEQAHRMRHLTTIRGQAHRIVKAVNKLREDFAKPLRIEDVAREIGMSVSGFHAHFKAVTAMSPLQFQKRLRLQEARRLMLTENLDAAEAGFQVGYDDASHFSREYKRLFGDPPLRDIHVLRELTLIREAA
ncbi:MAG: AraC family transcriptional regulator [Verrucomicrobia bacterium]|jgi:AraC-like DNA-binding protein|nr:AraC family transcriptional regulator [Verrucomicrobiota bacterium]